MEEEKKRKRLNIFIIVFTIITVIVLSFYVDYRYKAYVKYNEKILKEEKLVDDIKNHYSKKVNTLKDTYLYNKKDDKYVIGGRISKNELLTLKDLKINKDSLYFYSDSLGYYLYYKDVEPTNNDKVVDKRYKNYVLFNENVITQDEVKLYRDDKCSYTIYSSIDKPIIRKDDGGYYIEYFDEELFVKKEDVLRTYEHSNTDVVEASSIPVTVYHFIFLEGDTSCNEVICHPESQIAEQFTYLNNNNFFTINTTELRLFIEGKLRLPKKSILVTIDDGARAENFIPYLEKYKINATLFLISSWWPKEKFQSPYLEIASHSHNLHYGRKCPGGQGSELRCMDKDFLVKDLKMSRDELKTDAFCFPFYEFNDYAIDVVKTAGFKMAFIGGNRKASKGINLYKIPRIPINRYTTLNQYASYIN